MTWYDPALICMNGHVINRMWRAEPQRNTKFCKKCGAPAIMQCPECKTEIQGQFMESGAPRVPIAPPPNFCHNCGAPYPWTQYAINAATELAHGLEGFTQEEKEELSKSIDDLVRETPHAPVAAERYKKAMKKAGHHTAGAFKSIMYSVVSEMVKRQIWPSG